MLDLADDILQLLRHVEEAFEQVPRSQDALILSLLASKLQQKDEIFKKIILVFPCLGSIAGVIDIGAAQPLEV